MLITDVKNSTLVMRKTIVLKILLILTGVLIIVLGLFLSVLILVYAAKERDSYGYYYLTISSIIILLGILILRFGIIKSQKK